MYCDFSVQQCSFKKIFYFRVLIEKSINAVSTVFYPIKQGTLGNDGILFSSQI